MRDRRLVRRFLCRARGVDVNPLTIAGRVRELRDAILRDDHPVADRDFLADAIADRGDVDRDHTAAAPAP